MALAFFPTIPVEAARLVPRITPAGSNIQREVLAIKLRHPRVEGRRAEKLRRPANRPAALLPPRSKLPAG